MQKVVNNFEDGQLTADAIGNTFDNFIAQRATTIENHMNSRGNLTLRSEESAADLRQLAVLKSELESAKRLKVACAALLLKMEAKSAAVKNSAPDAEIEPEDPENLENSENTKNSENSADSKKIAA